MNKISKIIALILGLSILFSVGFYYQQKPKTILLSSKNCNLPDRPCTIKYQGEKLLTIYLEPAEGSRRINNLEPFEFKIINLQSAKYVIDKFNIQFQGIDMNLNSFSDIYTKDKKEYLEKMRLPYCTLKKMKWNLKVSFTAYKEERAQRFMIINQFDVLSIK